MLQPTRQAGASTGLGGHGRGCRARQRARQRVALALLSWCLLAALPLAAQDITLNAPLTTLVRGWTPTLANGRELRGELVIPADAPADLGVGAFVEDRHGRWFQYHFAGPFPPGRHTCAVAVDAIVPWTPQGHDGAWDAATAARVARGGFFLWSASTSRAQITVTWQPARGAPPVIIPFALRDLTHDGAHVGTGQRHEVRFRVAGGHVDPYHPEAVPVQLVVRDPAGAEQRFAPFHRQPMRRHDRGDREIMIPAGAAHHAVRWRARQPGAHQLRLEWPQGRAELGTVIASGEPWDDYVRVDAADPRFFSVANRFVWPQGPNLRSVWDLRARERLDTRLTPDRGTFAYDAYLERAAAGGADACEIWLSAWNLALEWNGAWDGFHGLTAFNEGNAERLDHILNRAEALGIRVNLVINNHGQGSDRTDREWDTSPWNVANGGPLRDPGQLFTDPRAFAGQDRLRRYLIARYADSPAILGWKLWSEMNLTAGGRSELRAWHLAAGARWRELDPYGHPVTSHWSGDYRTVDQALAAEPGIDFISIDAYHPPRDENGIALANLFADGTTNFHRGLARLGKPVIITEFGGNWSAGPPAQIAAEHRSGSWLALVTGYAGGPMLWWFEWIDQGDRWGVYRPVRAFLVGEDLRGSEARHLTLNTSAGPRLWAGCWSRPGRRLGYLLDADWGAAGTPGPVWAGVTLDHGAQVPAGPIVVEWWDADRGTLIERKHWEHPGGPLVVTAPAFRHHIAFKLWRDPALPLSGSAEVRKSGSP